MAAFNGLQDFGCVEVRKEGYFDREILQGPLTNFVARDELLERLHQIKDHPALTIKQDLNGENIICRDAIDGQLKDVEYDNNPKTDEYRQNLKTINQFFQKHWADLEIKDTELGCYKLSLGPMMKNNQQIYRHVTCSNIL